ncbi:MAG: 50S ribosomal protein L9 [Polyangiaceae bacterium]
MPATIQVILREDVPNVGSSGELVKVRPGFARNYLLPRKLASPATTAQVNRVNHEKAVALVRTEKMKKEFRELAGKLGALEIKIAHKVGEDDRLFGSVTSKEIHHAVEAKGLKLDRKKIALAEPIRALGTYEVPVKLLADITATLKVEVVKK